MINLPEAELPGGATPQPAKQKAPIDTSNEFMIGASADTIVLHAPIPHVLSRDQAIRLAAWLAVLADPQGEQFNRTLQAIRES